MRMPLTNRLLALLAAAVLIAGACGGDNDDPVGAADSDHEHDDNEDEDHEHDTDSAASPTAAPDPTEVAVPTAPPVEVDNSNVNTKPVVLVPEEDAPTELVSEDLVLGSGPEAAAGDFLIMQYVGVAYSTGVEFDASWDRGQPFTFRLGQGQVIQGWDEGIAGMAAGGRRLLTIPPDQAYGESGSGSGSIGPNETLIFMVDLVGVVSGDLEKPEVAVPDEAASELVANDLVEGTGTEATSGSFVYVHYVGVSQSTGEQFDSSWDRGVDQTIAFTLGIGQVISGWDDGIDGMKVGGRRELIIPPDQAYGEAGAGGGLIAPNETLIFVVDLIAVVSGPAS